MNPKPEHCITLETFHQWVLDAAYFVFVDSVEPHTDIANYYTGEDQIRARLKRDGIVVVE
jgi:hypothetical protein